jgi:sulfate permease, SulP family
VVLIGAIVVSALLDLDGRGVSVVGELPEALPDPSLPDVGWADVAHLIPPAFGIMIVSAEAVGVGRALATKDGYQIDVNRELYAMGAANALAGLSSGFVQSGGASQTAAAENAGGKTQLASVIAGVLILLTGAFLTGLFADLPQATLAAIVIVAVASFLNLGELRRFASIRPTALLQALVALAGVLLLGVLPGLLVAAALSLVILIHRLSRPPVERLEAPSGMLAVRVAGPLIYANATSVKEHLLGFVQSAEPPPKAVVIQLYQGDIDVESLDMLDELNDALAAEGVELRLTRVRPAVLRLLRRSGLAERVRIEPAERRVD